MALPKPRRRTATHTSAPSAAKVNRTPNPNYTKRSRPMADNINAAPTRRSSGPIKHNYQGREYTLRYKTPQEWEAFGRMPQNKGIDPEFWDSPIISKDKTDFSDSPIHTEKSAYEKIKGKLSRTRNAEPIYGYNDDQKESLSSGDYARRHTEESLIKRKETAARRKAAKDEARTKKQMAADIQQDLNYYERAMYQGGQQTGKVVGVIKREKYRWVTLVAKSMIMGWYFGVQLPLFVASMALIGGGGLTSGFISEVAEWLPFLGRAANFLAAPLFAGGFTLGYFNGFLSLMVIGGICMLFSITGIKVIRGSGWKLVGNILIFGAMVFAYIFPFTQFFPWGYFWVSNVGNNPE